jgi:hypothetical protein
MVEISPLRRRFCLQVFPGAAQQFCQLAPGARVIRRPRGAVSRRVSMAAVWKPMAAAVRAST